MIAALLKGFALGIMLSISVGPVIFSIIKHSINNGHKAGYAFVAGVSFSDITLVLICNLFTALFATLLDHKTAIALVGSLFLIAMGIYTFFFKKVAVDEKGDRMINTLSKKDMIAVFVSGFLMNTLNPGAFLFWFAWSAAILTDSLTMPNPFQYRIFVFGGCLIFTLLSDIAKVLLAGKLRNSLTPKTMHRINQLSGLILIGFGVALMYGIVQFGDKFK